MHDPLRLGAGQAGQDALQHAGALGQRHPPHPRPQRAPLDVLHRDVRRPVVLEVVVHGHDVRVAERTGHARLAHEPLRERGVGRVEGSELLQRDEPVQVALAREVDRRHAAAPQLAEDLVAADRLHRFGHQPASLPGRGVPVKATREQPDRADGRAARLLRRARKRRGRATAAAARGPGSPGRVCR